jgi:PAS domain S-box-containing protein
MRLKTGSKLPIGILLVLVYVCIVLFTSLFEFRSLRNSEKKITHTHTIVLLTEKLLNNTILAEDACRGYLLTRDKKHLDQLHTAHVSVQKDLEQLKVFTAADAEQQKNLDSLSVYFNKSVAFSNRKVFVADSAGQNAAMAMMISYEATINSEKINFYISLIQKQEFQRSVIYDKDNDNRAFALTITLLLLAGLILALLVYFLLQLYFRNVKSKKLAQSLKEINNQLVVEVNKNTAETSKVMEQIDDAVVTIDENWNFVYLNKNAEKVLNQNAASLLGKNVKAEYAETVSGPFFEALSKASVQKQTVRFEEYSPTVNAWLSCSIYPLDNGHITIYFHDVTNKKQAELALKESEEKYRNIVEAVSEGVWFIDKNNKTIFANKQFTDMLGYTPQFDKGFTPYELIIDRHGQGQTEENVRKGQKEHFENYFIIDSKRVVWVAFEINPLIRNNCYEGSLIISTDITSQKKAELLLETESRVMEKIALNQPLHETLDAIVLNIEACIDGAICSILLTEEDGLRVVHGSAPHLPESYIKAINGLYVGEGVGACGTAVFRKEPVIVEDINSDPLWKDFKGLATLYGLRACWSTPILTDDKKVLGTFAVYYTEIRKPSAAEFEVVNRATSQAKIAIEKNYSDKVIEESEKKYRSLVEQAIDAIFIADLNGRFITVNKSGETLTQYSVDELMQKSFFDFTYEEDLKKNPLKIEELLRGETVVAERRMKRRDGSVIDIEIATKYMGNQKILSFVRDISERKKAQAALEESEQKYRTLAEQATDTIFISELSGRFITINKSGEKLTQYSTDEMLNMSFYDFTDADDIKVNPLKIEELKKGKTATSQRKLKRKDGSLIDIEITAKLLPDGKLLSFIRDVSERKKAEQLIIDSEARYRAFFENSMDCIFLGSPDGTIYAANPAASKVYGYTENEFKQVGRSGVSDKSDISMKELLEERTKVGFAKKEVIQRKKDGTFFPAEITSSIFKDAFGQERTVVIVRDISDRVKANNEIIKEKNLSDTIINSLPGVFYLYSHEWKFLRWNKNFEIRTGYTTEEIANMHPLDFFSSYDQEAVSNIIKNAFITGEESAELSVNAKSGKKAPYFLTGKLIDYEGKPSLLGIGFDITDRVKAQEEVKQANEQLRLLTTHLQQVREEERKRIAREIHDELGQLLTATKMEMAWVDKHTSDEKGLVKAKIKNVLHYLDTSNHSVRNILKELRMGVLEDNGLVDALQWLSRQFTITTSVPVTFNSSEPVLKVDENVAICIFRTYQEALNNVAKHAHAKNVAASVGIENDYIALTIKDDGEGFDVSSLKHKVTFGILGLKERLAGLNGFFDLKTNPGEGTAITVKVPLKKN